MTADFAEERDGAFAPPNAIRGDANDRSDLINMSTKKSSGAWQALGGGIVYLSTLNTTSLCACGFVVSPVFSSFQPTSRPGPEEKQRVNLHLIVLHNFLGLQKDDGCEIER